MAKPTKVEVALFCSLILVVVASCLIGFVVKKPDPEPRSGDVHNVVVATDTDRFDKENGQGIKVKFLMGGDMYAVVESHNQRYYLNAYNGKTTTGVRDLVRWVATNKDLDINSPVPMPNKLDPEAVIVAPDTSYRIEVYYVDHFYHYHYKRDNMYSHYVKNYNTDTKVFKVVLGILYYTPSTDASVYPWFYVSGDNYWSGADVWTVVALQYLKEQELDKFRESREDEISSKHYKEYADKVDKEFKEWDKVYAEKRGYFKVADGAKK